jgi:hypothetical protein
MTDRQQEYTMRTEKTTKSAMMTEIESGYTRGVEMSVTLKTPGELLEANAGYKREYSLTHLSGQSFEEELHWGVDSVIKVSNTRTTTTITTTRKTGKNKLHMAGSIFAHLKGDT